MGSNRADRDPGISTRSKHRRSLHRLGRSPTFGADPHRRMCGRFPQRHQLLLLSFLRIVCLSRRQSNGLMAPGGCSDYSHPGHLQKKVFAAYDPSAATADPAFLALLAARVAADLVARACAVLASTGLRFGLDATTFAAFDARGALAGAGVV